MENVERLLKGTVEELEKLMDAKHVLGDPIEKDGATIIPMVSYGFGFGAGGGTHEKKGQGTGTGAGGGIKPVGAIIIDQEGARVVGIRGTMTSVAETLAKTAATVMEKSAKDKDETEA